MTRTEPAAAPADAPDGAGPRPPQNTAPTSVAVRPAPGRPGGAGLISALGIVSRRSLRHASRDVESMLMAVLLPVMLMLIFVFVMGEAMAVGESAGREEYLAYVLPAIALTTAGFGASHTAVVVSNDLTTGLMDRLRTMPFPAVTVLLGHVVSSMARNLTATAVVLGLAALLGFRPAADLPQLAAALGLIALWILAVTCVFTFIGLLAGSAEAAGGYGFILLFLPYISSGFAPVETMPDWLQGFAAHQPMTPIIDAARELLAGDAAGSAGWIGVLWCVGIIVAAVGLTTVVFPRRAGRG
ncbi:ABC transporter permease [Nesterenkonia sp. F]|uniref:ABC transporter permease n=1 Tax=Nesterenkonia sp. F TaxID=795955 RepID=UPI000255C8AD|nr:ABC transporter permease [Nesterenkonia sp. F]